MDERGCREGDEPEDAFKMRALRGACREALPDPAGRGLGKLLRDGGALAKELRDARSRDGRHPEDLKAFLRGDAGDGRARDGNGNDGAGRDEPRRGHRDGVPEGEAWLEGQELAPSEGEHGEEEVLRVNDDAPLLARVAVRSGPHDRVLDPPGRQDRAVKAERAVLLGVEDLRAALEELSPLGVDAHCRGLGLAGLAALQGPQGFVRAVGGGPNEREEKLARLRVSERAPGAARARRGESGRGERLDEARADRGNLTGLPEPQAGEGRLRSELGDGELREGRCGVKENLGVPRVDEVKRALECGAPGHLLAMGRRLACGGRAGAVAPRGGGDELFGTRREVKPDEPEPAPRLLLELLEKRGDEQGAFASHHPRIELDLAGLGEKDVLARGLDRVKERGRQVSGGEARHEPRNGFGRLEDSLRRRRGARIEVHRERVAAAPRVREGEPQRSRGAVPLQAPGLEPVQALLRRDPDARGRVLREAFRKGLEPLHAFPAAAARKAIHSLVSSPVRGCVGFVFRTAAAGAPETPRGNERPKGAFYA